MNENYIFEMECQIRRLQLENEMLNNLLRTSLGGNYDKYNNLYDNLILIEQNRQLKDAVAGLKNTINGLEMISRMPVCIEEEEEEAKIKMAPCQPMNSTIIARSKLALIFVMVAIHLHLISLIVK